MLTECYLTRNTCRSCQTVLGESLLNLGRVCLNDFPDTPVGARRLRGAPLDLVICPGCGLVQLRHTADPQYLYRDQYWYHSGINETMRAELADVVAGIRRVFGPLRPEAPQLAVLDIGANDGTLLHSWPDKTFRVAVEPCLKFRPILERVAHTTYAEYFPLPASLMRDLAGGFDVITAIAMCYDLEDPVAFFRAIRQLLRPEGVAVIQFQDLLQMVQRTAFDNICHEHLEYYSLTTLLPILRRTGLHAVGVETRAINGGSLRVYLMPDRTGYPEGEGAGVVDQIEREARQLTPAALTEFAWRVNEIRQHLHAVVTQASQHGPVDWYGASTKSNTLLQACGLSVREIRQAVERSPEKWGRYTAGTLIPIVSEERWRHDPAPVTVVGIWQFREAILQRESAYLRNGGRFFFPLPCADMVTEGAC
jgi:SAM-dependent methyltransferase